MTDKPFKITKTHLISTPLIITSLCGSLLLATGCQPTTTNPNAESEAQASTDATVTQPNTVESETAKTETDIEHEEVNTELIASTRNQPLTIDWQAIDSGVSPINPDSFNYPFALDSNTVQAQVEFSNISPEQAQRSLTLGMVSNEPIEKIIDQIGDSYLSHSFSPESATLFVYTTPNVTASQHGYVIADQFARGLTLPIVITSELPKSTNVIDANTNTNTSN